jgi:hypothetical protein
MTLHPILLNFLTNEENFIFFFYQCTIFAAVLQYFLGSTKIKQLHFKKVIKKKKFTASDSSIPGALHPPHADAREHCGLAEAKRGRRHQIRGHAQDASGRAERSHQRC